MNIQEKIEKLEGPIFVFGAGGFIGANILNTLSKYRDDCFGDIRNTRWRLTEKSLKNSFVYPNIMYIDEVNPKIIINCRVHGAYSYQNNCDLIYSTNFDFVRHLLVIIERDHKDCTYIHAGTSSEYGFKNDGADGCQRLTPNSHYAISKAAASQLVYYYGQHRGLRCANLRLYSVYGPLEDESRLIPQVVKYGLQGKFPEFVNPKISRDFVYIDDVVEAFIDAALNIRQESYGEPIHIGNGDPVTIKQVADTAREVFCIPDSVQPSFAMNPRNWDSTRLWYSGEGMEHLIHWIPATSFIDGLRKTKEYIERL